MASNGYVVFTQREFDENTKLKFDRDQGVDRFYSMITNSGPCDICGDDDDNRLHILPCEHVACRTCWKNYIAAEIEKGEREIVCIYNSSCKRRLNDKEIASLITVHDKTSGTKYDSKKLIDLRQLNIRRYYMAQIQNLMHCPQKNCDNIIEIHPSHANEKISITCKCNFKICSTCKQEDHAVYGVLNCKESKDFSKVINDLKWISGNTKPCPNCKTPIQKNEGCQHMSCRLCSHQFCWQCLQNWSGHSNCRTLSPDEIKNMVATNFCQMYNSGNAQKNSTEFYNMIRKQL